MELKMHFEFVSSRLRPHVCEPKCQSFLNTVLESSIVIVEGVTLVLIDKEEEKRKPS